MANRDDLASAYLDTLPFDPYPVQEEALLAWFEEEEGVLVCAPTGTGKTLIAEAACYEALATGRVCYYTTPLIALTDQKFHELQESAERWGFSRSDVGLVTGNRSVNPDAKVLVVVAEILLNRLLEPAEFDFQSVASVVMDEFHNFADPERGIAWELSLGLLPEHARLLLLSATVGNAVDFLQWLRSSHGRKLRLVQSSNRRVPLTYHWIDEELLGDQLEKMAQGEGEQRLTPALVFCFNRAECWTVAEQLKGRSLISDEDQKTLAGRLDDIDLEHGAGPKLKQLLLRGVAVHHAGLLPKHRRVVEELYQLKLLPICVCTETLAAGINLPARSVLLTTLLKGPPREKKLIDASSAHQMFGRAGRPQFDKEGHVFAISHEDDVKIARWKEKYDAIPEDTKDPLVLKAKKRMKKKQPTRRSTEQYWNRSQFDQLLNASPGRLTSRGPMPWRLLAHLLSFSPEVELLRSFVRKRLMDPKKKDQSEKDLQRKLMTLHAGGYVRLEPPPPDSPKPQNEPTEEAPQVEEKLGTLGALLAEANVTSTPEKTSAGSRQSQPAATSRPTYWPERAVPLEPLRRLLAFRAINPLYGDFLVTQFDVASPEEILQLMESVLEIARSVHRSVRVPNRDLPPGPLAERVEPALLAAGLATEDEIRGRLDVDFEDRVYPLALAEKVERLFRGDFPDVRDLRVHPVWVAPEILQFDGDFNRFIRSKELAKQEGLIFRHLLRLVLLLGEFHEHCPLGWDMPAWQNQLRTWADQFTATCRAVDPASTDKMIEQR